MHDLQERLPDLTARLRDYEAGRQAGRSTSVRLRYFLVLAQARCAIGTRGGLLARDGRGEIASHLIYSDVAHPRRWPRRSPTATGVSPPSTTREPVARRPATRRSAGRLDLRRRSRRPAHHESCPAVDDGFAARRAKGVARLVKYLREEDRFGPALAEAQRADLAALLGRDVDDVDEGLRETLCERIRAETIADGPVVEYCLRDWARAHPGRCDRPWGRWPTGATRPSLRGDPKETQGDRQRPDRAGHATMTELRFDDRVVAITGAHHGLGREHALLLAARGAKVVANDLQGAAATVEAILAAGGEAIENTSDITTGAGTDQIVRDALTTWGRLDIIVNNAAAGETGALVAEDSARSTIDVHFFGTQNLIRSAMPVFREQRYGRIVNTSSGSIMGIPHTGTYAAGKGAVLALSRVLANDLRAEPELDVAVNVILPAAQTPNFPPVPDQRVQDILEHAFAPSQVSPVVAVLAHESCPVSGEAIQVGAGRVSRIVLATTEGWQGADGGLTPENVIGHWDDIMANRDLPRAGGQHGRPLRPAGRTRLHRHGHLPMGVDRPASGPDGPNPH